MVAGGIWASALGIILYTQLGRIEEAAHSLGVPWVLGVFVDISLVATVGGLLCALTGGVIWGRRAPLNQVPVAAAIVALVGFLLSKFVNVNMHGPTAIFVFVIPAAAAMAVLFVLITVIRLVESRS